MISVIIHWENAAWVDKYQDAQRKIFKYYTLTLKAFGYNKLIIVDKHGTMPTITDAEMDASVFSTLEEAMEHTKDSTFVFVENNPDAPVLKDFEHPAEDVCYVLGSDYDKLPETDGPKVRIDAGIPLWAHVALAIVLNDRNQKL